MTRTQNPAPGVRTGSTPAPPGPPSAPATTTLARLQLLLAGLWLIDGLLRFQPFMFRRDFAAQTLLPAATGNPGWIATPVTWAGTLVENHPATTNIVFAFVQLALGVGIAVPRSRAAAIACSAVWAAAVWYFGEGLGGLATGQANPISGAPGSASVYLLTAILLLPAREAGTMPPATQVAQVVSATSATPATPRSAMFPAAPVAAARVGEDTAKGLWTGFWLVLAYLTLLPVNRAAGAFSGAMNGGTMAADGGPSWLTSLDGWAADAVTGDDRIVAIVLTALLMLIAACVWAPNPRVRRAGLLTAGLLAAAYWVFGQGFGMPFSGEATDPGTGPLLVLLAAAFWPAARAGRRAPAASSLGAATVRRTGVA